MTTYAFIDASNLFYGGEKSLGWKIDYQKLLKYLNNKYKVEKAFYFGGVNTHDFQFDYLNEESINLNSLKKHIENLIEKEKQNINKSVELEKSIQKLKFYKKLEEFGYILILKPIKIYRNENGSLEVKANCDVDMTFYMMNFQNEYNEVVVLSGDGDFLPVLKYIKSIKKEVNILSRSKRTSKEIRKFAGNKFQDFEYLKELIQQTK